MPKVTKILGNNKARACESLGFAHKKRGCACFDTPSLYVMKEMLYQIFKHPFDDHFCADFAIGGFGYNQRMITFDDIIGHDKTTTHG